MKSDEKKIPIKDFDKPPVAVEFMLCVFKILENTETEKLEGRGKFLMTILENSIKAEIEMREIKQRGEK